LNGLNPEVRISDICAVKKYKNLKQKVQMNSKSKVLALVIFLFSTAVFANTTPIKMLVVSDATRGVYKVVYRNAESGKVKVSIYTGSHELVFSETIANVESFVRPYNFSNLSQGAYTIVVEDKNGKTEEKVSYYFKKVQSIVEVTKIANEANKYLLSVENKDADLIDVKILDAESNILHQQSMTVNGKFSVIYNLTAIKGEITFEVIGSDGLIKTIKY